MWGAQTLDSQPDFVSCAKQLSGAYLPISAVLVPEHVYEVIRDNSGKIGTFGHGFTYGGHPVAAAVALRALELYEERDILGHVNTVSPRFQARLRKLADHPLVGEARGVGLRSEEHTSELQSLMRISYAVFCLNKKNNQTHTQHMTYDD